MPKEIEKTTLAAVRRVNSVVIGDARSAVVRIAGATDPARVKQQLPAPHTPRGHTGGRGGVTIEADIDAEATGDEQKVCQVDIGLVV